MNPHLLDHLLFGRSNPEITALSEMSAPTPTVVNCERRLREDGALEQSALDLLARLNDRVSDL